VVVGINQTHKYYCIHYKAIYVLLKMTSFQINMGLCNNSLLISYFDIIYPIYATFTPQISVRLVNWALSTDLSSVVWFIQLISPLAISQIKVSNHILVYRLACNKTISLDVVSLY